MPLCRFAAQAQAASVLDSFVKQAAVSCSSCSLASCLRFYWVYNLARAPFDKQRFYCVALVLSTVGFAGSLPKF